MRHTCFALISGVILCCGFAHADMVGISLSPPSLSGAPGDVLTFIGTLDNTTNVDVFLNADSFTLNGFGSGAIDDSPFFNNAPVFLNPNGTTGSIGLFNIAIPNGFAPGTYDGAFDILGGATLDDQSVIGSANFEVQVTAPAATSPVPEPASVVLLLSVLIVVTVVYKRSRQSA